MKKKKNIIILSLLVVITFQCIIINKLQTICGEYDTLVNRLLKEKREQIESQIPTEQWQSLGIFEVTAYCHCELCNDQWAYGNTFSGTYPEVGRTIAVDPSVIELGSEIMIDDHVYIAEDTGSGITGNHIDIYMGSHDEAIQFGRRTIEAYE